MTISTINFIFRHGLGGYLKLIFSNEEERIGRIMTDDNKTNKSIQRRRSLMPISINLKHISESEEAISQNCQKLGEVYRYKFQLKYKYRRKTSSTSVNKK